MELVGSLSKVSTLTGKLNNETLLGYMSSSLKYSHYTGRYELTPNKETQTLYTKDLLMNKNVVVNPIPSNYGLITWNGHKLTVS